MTRYFVSTVALPEDEHEVHKDGCYWLRLIKNKMDLGAHPDCKSAVKEAKKTFRKVNGCMYCCEDCHS